MSSFSDAVALRDFFWGDRRRESPRRLADKSGAPARIPGSPAPALGAQVPGSERGTKFLHQTFR